MSAGAAPRVAIVDYGMGNLFSVRQACEAAGLHPVVTSSPADLLTADGVILPGVGAFADAMHTLVDTGLADALRRVAHEGVPLLGICLGMQLVMEESTEFGRHGGLGLIAGRVVRFPERSANGASVKVPHIGWNRVCKTRGEDAASGLMKASLLDGLEDGAFMYFVHSYYVVPDDPDVVCASAEYAGVRFCAALCAGRVMACQFHPERSGEKGLRIYQNMASLIRDTTAHA